MMNMVHSLRNGLWTKIVSDCRRRRKRNTKEEETEAQIEENGTKMVLHLNDELNGPKCNENGALSLHNSLWSIRLFHRTKKRKWKPRVEKTVRRWCYL